MSDKFGNYMSMIGAGYGAEYETSLGGLMMIHPRGEVSGAIIIGGRSATTVDPDTLAAFKEVNEYYHETSGAYDNDREKQLESELVSGIVVADMIANSDDQTILDGFDDATTDSVDTTDITNGFETDQ